MSLNRAFVIHILFQLNISYVKPHLLRKNLNLQRERILAKELVEVSQRQGIALMLKSV
jgi:sugar phosphate permease